MSLAKKLEWSARLLDEKTNQTESPDSTRPGGKVPDPSINISDYEGKSGRARLINLSITNPSLYKKILETKKLS